MVTTHSTLPATAGSSGQTSCLLKVIVGGATEFALPLEQFVKL